MLVETSNLDTVVFADESAFLWTQRHHQAHSPIHGLEALSRIDERLEATLEGLFLDRDSSRDQLQEMLYQSQPGAVSSGTCLALLTDDEVLWSQLVEMASQNAGAERELTAALAWLPDKAIAPCLEQGLKPPARPVLQRACLNALRAHRSFPDELTRFIGDREPEDSTAPWIHLLAAHGLSKRLPPAEKSTNKAHQGWLTWAACLSGQKVPTEPLLHAIENDIIPSDIGLVVICQTLPTETLDDWIDRLVSDKASLNIALQACGIQGTVSAIDRLFQMIPCLSGQRQLKHWAQAFSRITGFYPEKDTLRQNKETMGSLAFDDDEIESTMVPIDFLPHPDPARAQTWWKTSQRHFKPSSRYRQGLPLKRQYLLHELHSGSQAERRLAAYELAILLQIPIFPVTAPVWRQQLLMTHHSYFSTSTRHTPNRG